MYPRAIWQPFAFLSTGWRYRNLIRRLAWRRIETRYRGSALGMFWTFINPLLMLSVYCFVFSVIFRARWGLPEGGHQNFALLLFSGLIYYTVFSECVNEAPGLVLSHRSFVKELTFPIEVLPWASLLTALFSFSMNFLVFSVFFLIVYGLPPVSAIWFPLLLCPMLLGTLGIMWALASLGVFLRDISQIVGVLTTALLFLSPIFYPTSHIPEPFRPFYYVNPFASLLEMTRNALFAGEHPDWRVFSILAFGSWVFAWCGYAWFMTTKKAFADVL